tara:strand:- start:216 stop:1319 length:1104 start_codon:yes stop_codon:yes gene_type:complete
LYNKLVAINLSIYALLIANPDAFRSGLEVTYILLNILLCSSVLINKSIRADAIFGLSVLLLVLCGYICTTCINKSFHGIVSDFSLLIRISGLVSVMLWASTLSKEDYLSTFQAFYRINILILIFAYCFGFSDRVLGCLALAVVGSLVETKRPVLKLGLVALLAWLFEDRSIVMAIAFVVLYSYTIKCIRWDLVSRFWLFSLILILLILNSALFINSESDYMNKVLSKRPFIATAYINETLEEDLVRAIFGNGVVNAQIAGHVGDLVKHRFDNSREYSPHSLYVGVFYEFGLVGLILLSTIVAFGYLVRSSISGLNEIFVFLTFAGLTVPVFIGGRLICSMLFVAIFILINHKPAVVKTTCSLETVLN